jgi:hypothetical protein
MMDLKQKVEYLRKFETAKLMQDLTKREDELEKVLQEQLVFTKANFMHLSSRGSDSSKVKEILAILSTQVPEEHDKKVADREAWLTLQRKENKELAEAITKQREAEFVMEDFGIRGEMAKKRLEGIRSVIGLRTAQINFLAE